MKITNQNKNTVLAENARLADTVLTRLTGLLNRSSLNPDEGLVITQCRSIHMFFMKFAIDVVFVDKTDRVVGLVERIKPFRMSPYFLKAACAVELPAGRIAESRTEKGDIILFGA